MGLSVSIAKCRLWAPAGVALPEDLLPEVPRVQGCIRVLGVPTGKPEEVEAALEENLLDWGRGLEELPALGDAQVALSLLRQCATAHPRYLQRTLAPTPGVLSVYSRFDRQLRGVVAGLLGEELAHSDDAAPTWARQAALPMKWGGTGLGDLTVTAPAAYLGCWAQTTPLLVTRFPVDDRFALASALLPRPAPELPFQISLQEAFTLPHPPRETSLLTFLRAALSPPLDTASLIASVWSHAFEALLQEAPDPSTLARLRSVSAPASGAWLQAIPSSIRTAFGNAEFLSALRLRLGLQDPAWSGLSCL